jgi:hypothetical protein
MRPRLPAWAVGVWQAVTGRDLGVPDHGAIVWTSWSRSCWCCSSSATMLAHRLRVPHLPWIRYPDPRRSGNSTGDEDGFGVMLDDLLRATHSSCAVRQQLPDEQ